MNFSTTTIAVRNITSSFCKMIVPTYTLSLTLLSCSLSIFGSFVIIITYLNLQQIQNFTRKLLLSLTVADLLTAVGNLIGSVRYFALRSKANGCELVQVSDSVCIVQSFITTFSSMASFFWTTVIALHIYMQIARESPGMRTGLMLLGYQVMCWGIPGIITVTALSLEVLGSDDSVGTGSWCWIRAEVNDHAQIVWMIMSGKGWEILCYVLTAGLYMLSKIAIWAKRRANRWRRFGMRDVEDMRTEDENFLYVPLVLYVLRIWGTTRFFLAIFKNHINSVHLTRAQEVLLVFQSIGDSAQAFFNCVLFCFCDATVRNYLYTVLFRRHREDLADSETDERTPIQT
ncbi:G-protein coupled receptor 157-like [Mercenaria mercenaria]|uniref:G-protein coupled receptor 157-like n=1 Tax=Mercenaria mercenaria TaxID=6596 RepID=UPI00234F94B4|nr:G-protein coupled receptor 157-like [Mercenaria mercenaria]